MTIVPVEWDGKGNPVMWACRRYHNGRVFVSHRAESIGKVCALAFINAKVSMLKAEVCNKMRIPSEQWMMA